jgi:hypothetical protein
MLDVPTISPIFLEDNYRKPYHRIYRPFVKSDNEGWNGSVYLVDHEYAQSPLYYTRAFMMIQEDIKRLFEYIEPSYINLKTYSYRIYELFMRTCIEIEANFKAIFKENTFTKEEKYWTIKDYRRINVSHHLYGYTATFPYWDGNGSTFSPFKSWRDDSKLNWYRAYQESKHDRQGKRSVANLENLLNAFCALYILLTAQFNTQTYDPGPILLSIGSQDSYYVDGEFGIGDYLLIGYPDDWKEEEKYFFDWNELRNNPNRFLKYDYDKVKFSR